MVKINQVVFSNSSNSNNRLWVVDFSSQVRLEAVKHNHRRVHGVLHQPKEHRVVVSLAANNLKVDFLAVNHNLNNNKQQAVCSEVNHNSSKLAWVEVAVFLEVLNLIQQLLEVPVYLVDKLKLKVGKAHSLAVNKLHRHRQLAALAYLEGNKILHHSGEEVLSLVGKHRLNNREDLHFSVVLSLFNLRLANNNRSSEVKINQDQLHLSSVVNHPF